MVVNFDSLNRYEMPALVLCNPGSVYTASNGYRITNTIGELNGVNDVEIIFNFNAPSELNFRISKYEPLDDDDLSEEDVAYLAMLYRKVEDRRLIFVDNFGYFVITESEETIEGKTRYKDVSAHSCECELQRRGIPYIEDGTYAFNTLFSSVMAKAGRWSIGNVDQDVQSRYRTFEDVDIKENVYDFLVGDMQEAYECFFDFDIKTRRIHVLDKSNFITETSIYITNEDFVNKLDISESTDDLYTALTVTADNNVSINAVNPLGTNTIYDFSHYYDWMSSGLKEAVQNWQTTVDGVSGTYYNKNADYYGALNDEYDATMEKQRLDMLRTLYQRARDNIVAQASTDQVPSFNDTISDYGGTEIGTYAEIADTLRDIDGLIATTEVAITEAQADIDQAVVEENALMAEIEAIRESVSWEQNFTSEQLVELDDYVFEGDYTDEYVTITDSMDYAAQFAQIKTMYDRANGQLERIAHPIQEFSIDVDNFIFHKDFEAWTGELKTGCAIHVEVEEDDIAKLLLMEYTVNYEDQTLSMKFGNRYNKFDQASLFQDALGNINKTSNSISFLKNAVAPIKNGKVSQLEIEIENSRNLTKDAVLAATNESVVIDDTGYTGGRINRATGEMDPHQIKITGRNIAFTDNAWLTAKTAIGEIILPGGEETTTVYGINAEAIIGKMIVGSQIQIVDNLGNEVYASVDDAISSVMAEYALGDSSVTPPQGDVWSYVAPEWVDGKFMWQRTRTFFISGRESVSAPVCISGATGRPGVPATNITSIVPEYCLHTSDSVPPTDENEWTAAPPAWEEGKFIWMRSRIYWEDGAETTTAPVIDNSLNGFGDSMNEMRSQIMLDINGLSEQFESTYGNLSQWIRVGIIDDSTQPPLTGVQIGRQGDESNFSSIFTSDEIGFYEGNDKLAYLSNKKMNVKTVRTEAIELTSALGGLNGVESSQWRITTDDNDGFSISWIG